MTDKTQKQLSLAHTSKSRSKTPNAGQKRTRNRIRNSTFITRDEVKGGKLEVPPNPPDITYQPWMPLTVVMKHGGGELKATLTVIARTLVTQVDPTRHAFRTDADTTANLLGGPIFQLRFNSIRAWNLTGHMLALSVNDLSSEGKTNVDTLCGIVDTGSNTHTPVAGYKFPLSHRDFVLRPDKDNKDDPIFHLITPEGDTSIIYVNVLWRCDGPSKLSSFTESMLAVVKQIDRKLSSGNSVRKQMSKKVDSGVKDLDQLVEHSKTTIGSVIVKGAEVVAPFVIPALAAEDRKRLEQLTDAVRSVGRNYDSPFEVVSDIE